MVNAQALQETQDMKIPQLRNLYEKTGFDYLPGAKKRGFGFVHDGTIATLFDFLRLPVFSFGSNDGMRRDVEAFLLAFDTGMAPAVGAQRTVHAGNQNATVVVNWINTMIAQSGASNIDLVVKGRLNGVARGWVYASNNQFRSDLASEPLIDKDALRALAGTGSELTYTGVPPGTGLRIGIDRDEDGAFDRTEIAAGSDPTDPASLPGATAVGPNEDAVEGARWVGCFPNPAPNGRTTLAFEVPVRQHVTLHIYDARGRVVRTLVDGDAGPGLVRVPWDGSDQGGRRAASGKYFLRLESSGRTVAQPLLLVR
jgi:hypothetical protein